MYKVSGLVAGLTVEFETNDEKELIERASFLQSLPAVCPLDQSATRFWHKEIDGNGYYGVAGTGECEFTYKLGQFKNGGGLFPKGRWTWYDRESSKEFVVWDEGGDVSRLYWWDSKNEKKVFVNTPHPLTGAPAPELKATRATSPSVDRPVPYVIEIAHRNVVSDADLNAALEEFDSGAYGDEIDPTLFVPSPRTAPKGEFKWSTDSDFLGIAADLVQLEGIELSEEADALVTQIMELHKASGAKCMTTVNANGSGAGQYGYAAGLIDKVVAKGSHQAILSALCGEVISSDSAPGWKAKEIIELLKAGDESTIRSLKEIGEAIRTAVTETA